MLRWKSNGSTVSTMVPTRSETSAPFRRGLPGNRLIAPFVFDRTFAFAFTFVLGFTFDLILPKFKAPRSSLEHRQTFLHRSFIRQISPGERKRALNKLLKIPIIHVDRGLQQFR